MKYKGSSDAQRKAVAKYHAEKVEEIKIRVPKNNDNANKQYYKDAAARYDMSLNQFAIESMRYAIDNEVFKDK